MKSEKKKKSIRFNVNIICKIILDGVKEKASFHIRPYGSSVEKPIRTR